MAGVLPTARVGDRTCGVCSHPSHLIPISIGGVIVTGSTNSFCNGLPIARIGDTVMSYCGHTGHIVTGSMQTFFQALNVAKVGDKTAGVYVATIVQGSPNTFV